MLPALACTISKLTTMSDNTIRCQIDLQETTPENMAELFKEKGSMGYFFYSPAFFTEVKTDNLPELLSSGIASTKRSKSQEYRAKLYRYWEQSKMGGTFEEYYNQRMDYLIKQVEDKLQ